MFDGLLLLTANQMLNDIASAFANSRTDESVLRVVYITMGLVGITVVVYILWQRIRLRWERMHAPAAMTIKERLDLLDQALIHRSRFDVNFLNASASHKTMSCSLNSATAESMTLEIPAGITPSAHWIGRHIVCFFRIPGEDGHAYFYKFVTDISGLQRSGSIQYVVLPLPESIELGQKRRHLRLDIPQTDIQDFRIWSSPEDGTMPTDPDISTWPPPLAVYRQARTSALQILDLSGGGIRLEYDPRQFPTLNDFIAQHPILYMRLELRAVEGKLPLVYYLVARLRTKQEDFGSGALMLGYEFVEYGCERDDDSLEWIKIDPDQGIDALVTWVFRRHLELYREREFE